MYTSLVSSILSPFSLESLVFHSTFYCSAMGPQSNKNSLDGPENSYPIRNWPSRSQDDKVSFYIFNV